MTTPVPTRKLLKEYLEHLNDKRLKEFQWYLIQIEIDGSRPIPRSKLENATREETVDNLVEAFGEDGAVEWTVDTFFRMNLNDLAYKLVQAEPHVEAERQLEYLCQAWAKRRTQMQTANAKVDQSTESLCENYRGRSQGEPSGGHRNDTETFQTPTENIREKQKKVKQLRDSSIERIKTRSFSTKKITDDFKRRNAFLKKGDKTKRAASRKGARLKICVMHDRDPSAFDFRSEMKFSYTWQPYPGNPERSTHFQQNLHKSPKRRRVEQDSKNGKVSFHDHYTSMLSNKKTWSLDDDFSNLVYDDVDVMHVPVVDVTHVPVIGHLYEVEDEVEDEDEDEDEQGRAETFREEGAQS